MVILYIKLLIVIKLQYKIKFKFKDEVFKIERDPLFYETIWKIARQHKSGTVNLTTQRSKLNWSSPFSYKFVLSLEKYSTA